MTALASVPPHTRATHQTAPNALLAAVADYYSAKLAAAGPTPRGVDWNSPDAQRLRFAQLLKLVDLSRSFSLLDYGCGYGALGDFLTDIGATCMYLGYDVAPAMIDAARRLHRDRDDRTFTHDAAWLRPMDYAIASGVLNVTCGVDPARWEKHFFGTLDHLARLATRGFAFNALTSYGDPRMRRPDLYYADPCQLFDHCVRRYSRHVALLHDYGLYDFTILVKW